MYYGFGSDTHWNKYGQSYWYSDSNWDEASNATIFNLDPEHFQTTYLAYLRLEESISNCKTRTEVS